MLLALVLALSSPAEAGACCVGSTSTVPTRLGECERAMAGLALGAETSIGQWTATGESMGSSLQDDAVLATMAGAWRWDRKGQLGLSLPWRVNHKASSSLEAWGWGPGDLRLQATWDPMTEWARGGEEAALPVAILQGGLRLPTGRSWQQAEGVLLEDVTGLSGPGVLLGASVERTLDRTPWSLGLDSEWDVQGQAGERHLHGAFTAWGSLGRYLGRSWSVSAQAQHQQTAALGADDGRTARTSAGLKVTTSRPLRWRAWLGADGDLPVPGLGQSNLQQLRLGLGYAVVR